MNQIPITLHEITEYELEGYMDQTCEILLHKHLNPRGPQIGMVAETSEGDIVVQTELTYYRVEDIRIIKLFE